jgi:hypothetical protein
MRGTDDKQASMFLIVSPDRRVPADHPLRRIKAMAEIIRDDDRTTRHPGYIISQRKRKLVEESFGRMKTFGGFRRTCFKGLRRTRLAGTIVAAVYNMIRICTLQVSAA